MNIRKPGSVRIFFESDSGVRALDIYGRVTALVIYERVTLHSELGAIELDAADSHEIVAAAAELVKKCMGKYPSTVTS